MENLITIPIQTLNFTPIAGQTIYFSNIIDVPVVTYFDYRIIKIPYSFMIKVCSIFCHNDQVPAIPQPSIENWPLSIILNGITEISVGNQLNISPTEKLWLNSKLNYYGYQKTITLKLVNPNWAVVPNNCKIAGYLVLEII